LIEQKISGFPPKEDLPAVRVGGGVGGDGRLRSGEGASLLPEPEKQMPNEDDSRRDDGNDIPVSPAQNSKAGKKESTDRRPLASAEPDCSSKTANCQTLVSLTLARGEVPVLR
jgi:hypothetical protein